jgi:two-component system cell cycle sensor histidine kinase/response regulator CckA
LCSSFRPACRLSISAAQAIQGDLDGKLVQLDAELIGLDSAAAVPTLMLRSGGRVFPAILPPDTPLGAQLRRKEGSIVRITGVCNVQVDSLSTNLGEGAVRPKSMQVLLRSIEDVSVVHAPSWWTPMQLLEVLAAAGIVVLAAFTWIVVLRRRVKQQTQALRASEERPRHLSKHDALTGLPLGGA